MTTSISAPELRRTELTRSDVEGGRFGLIRSAPGWVLLGLAGCVLATVASGRLGGGTVRWWLNPRIPPGGATNRVVLYVGMIVIVIAWLGLGRASSARTFTPLQVAAVAALWCVTLVVCAA